MFENRSDNAIDSEPHVQISEIHEVDEIDEDECDSDEDIDKALHMAILSQEIDRVEELLEEGADANSCDDEGNSALYNACSTNNYELVDLIIAHADINDNGSSCSGLNATEDESIIQLLFTYGAFRDIDDYNGYRYYATYEQVYEFDDAFRDEVIINTLKHYGKSVETITLNLEENEEVEAELDDYIDEEMVDDLRRLGVRSIAGGAMVVDYGESSGSTYELNDLFEKVGYNVSYEGSNNSLEGQIGIYFVE